MIRVCSGQNANLGTGIHEKPLSGGAVGDVKEATFLCWAEIACRR